MGMGGGSCLHRRLSRKGLLALPFFEGLSLGAGLGLVVHLLRSSPPSFFLLAQSASVFWTVYLALVLSWSEQASNTALPFFFLSHCIALRCVALHCTAKRSEANRGMLRGYRHAVILFYICHVWFFGLSLGWLMEGMDRVDLGGLG